MGWGLSPCRADSSRSRRRRRRAPRHGGAVQSDQHRPSYSARRSAFGDFPIELQDALRATLDGDGLLFIGAGLSFLAKREGGETLPDATALTDLLLEQPTGTGSKHKLDRVSGAVVREKGVEFVYDLLVDHLTVHSVDARLDTLYDLPWKRIYTTNYDNAIELSREGRRPTNAVTLDDNQNQSRIGSVVHLNGYIKRISPHNIESGLLLTDTSYADSRLLETGWLSTLERDIRTSRAIIFAGYSIYDLDIERVLLNADGVERKAFFFVAPDADEIEVSTLERYGTVIPGGIDSLVDQINSVAVGYKPPTFATGLTSLREIRIDEDAPPGTAAQRIIEQLVYGALPEQEILADRFAFDDQRYLVRREQIDEALGALRIGPWRDMLITGEIAAGKSASTLDVARHLRGQGYRVYHADKGAALAADLAKIAGVNEKVAVIFDGYSPFRAEIADYASRRPLTHRMILTERSGIQEFIGDFIETTPGLGPVFHSVLDKITARDVAEFQALTNFGGFWEDRAGASLASRERYISDHLDASLYRLLLEIIRSQKVQDSIRRLLEPVSNDHAASKIFCSALIVNALRFEFAVSEWQYWFPHHAVKRLSSAYGDQVRHFLSFDASKVYVRSGLLSLQVLHTFLDNELVEECLLLLYGHAEKLSVQGGKWRALMIELMKFSSVEPMFSGSNKHKFVFTYYDKIRALGNTVNNPDYWLQVGIASTVFDDLPRGEICFKNAYAREKAKRVPNLTKIDNYAARFEMKSATAELDSKAAFDRFIAANEKMGRQIFLDINRHYPFKTGRYFSDMGSKHYDKWNDIQQQRFRAAAIDIRTRALEWKKVNKHQSSADVEILIKEINELISRIG